MKNLHQKVYLIRHGETEWTHSKQHTGLTDIPLIEEGRKQAEWLKKRLENTTFKKVFCSPLLRAKETCEITGLISGAEIDPDLVEWDYGDYEGKTTEQIQVENPKWTLFTNGVPNGESFQDVSARAEQVISRISEIEGNIALFSSGHFLRSLAATWLHLPVTEGKLLLLSTASISILGYERKNRVLQSWNITRDCQL